MDNVLCCTLLVIFTILFLQKYYLKNKKLPPSPPYLPIFGHLHIFKQSLQLHRILQNISNKYGPLVYLRLGNRPCILISSPSMAEECFTKRNDIIFSNRPKFIISDHLNYNHTTISLSPYGDHLRNLRRVTTNHIFSSAALNKFSVIRTQEVRSYVRKLFLSYNNGGHLKRDGGSNNYLKVNMESLFNELVLNVFMKVLVGRESDPETGKAAFSDGIPLNVCNFVPFLRWVGYGGFEKMIKSSFPEMDNYLQRLIDESRIGLEVAMQNNINNKTAIQSLLSLQEAEPEYYTDDILKGILQDIIGAGPDTSSSVIHWAMSLLLNHPEVMEKLRNEIDLQVTTSGHDLIKESDLPNLPYLRCVINEAQRLFPAGPLLLPRFSSDDSVVDGFNIPKGTILLVNAWAIHRDRNVWDEPEMFKPERFEEIKKLGSEFGFKFLPFGTGRRSCSGAGMAMRTMGLIIGTMIQCFEWERIGHELVDLEEGSGIVLHKVKPTEAFYRPRPIVDRLISQLRDE